MVPFLNNFLRKDFFILLWMNFRNLNVLIPQFRVFFNFQEAFGKSTCSSWQFWLTGLQSIHSQKTMQLLFSLSLGNLALILCLFGYIWQGFLNFFPCHDLRLRLLIFKLFHFYGSFLISLLLFTPGQGWGWTFGTRVFLGVFQSFRLLIFILTIKWGVNWANRIFFFVPLYLTYSRLLILSQTEKIFVISYLIYHTDVFESLFEHWIRNLLLKLLNLVFLDILGI